MTPQEIDRIECAIRHIQTAGDVDPWAVEIAVEAMKAQLSREDTTSDLISRQDAIDVLGVFTQADALGHTPKQIVEALPSAHPEIEERKEESAQNVPKEDLISRKAAIDAMGKAQWAKERLMELPFAQPEMNLDEWCTDCKEYDQERHCCPRWNRVIRQTLKDAQPEPQWIPVSERLPEVGRSVLFSRRSMDTREGCLQADDKWWQYRWNEILNANQVTAWMPLPEPYRAERRTDESDANP